MSNPGASEICTIDRATQLGIYVNDNNGITYKIDSAGDYNDLKTYNSDIDNSESKTQTLCKDNPDGVSSSRNCVDQFGPGFTKKLNSLGGGSPSSTGETQQYVCRPNDCPPGFSLDSSGNCTNTMRLPDAEIDKRSRCEERWYDWFVIPNYHLGNNFSNIGDIGNCYAPCPEFQVPSYAVDPVDGSTLDFVTNSDLTKCVSRNDYFYGKYQIGSDYCPLAWIHRLNATNPMLTAKMNAIYADFATSNANTNFVFQNYRNSQNITNISTQISQQCSSYLDNIDTPLTNTMENACIQLNTPDRVREAYNWCSELFNNEEEYALRINTESGDSTLTDKKIAMMKQACNDVFCNPNNEDALDLIVENSICFPQPPNIDPTTGEIITEDDKPYPEQPSGTNTSQVILNCIRLIIVLTLFPLLFILIKYIFDKFISKFIRKIWLPIERALGKDPTYQKYEEILYQKYRYEDDLQAQINRLESTVYKKLRTLGDIDNISTKHDADQLNILQKALFKSKEGPTTSRVLQGVATDLKGRTGVSSAVADGTFYKSGR